MRVLQGSEPLQFWEQRPGLQQVMLEAGRAFGSRDSNWLKPFELSPGPQISL